MSHSDRIVFVDGIIFALQKAGGVSALWGEHIQRLDPERCIIGSPGPNQNLVFNALNLERFNVVQSERITPRLGRYLPVVARELRPGMIFHSSYYRECIQAGVKRVLTVYDFAYERTRSGLARMVHSQQKFRAIRGADRIVCISDSTRRDLLHYCPDVRPERVSVAHLGVAAEFFVLPKPQVTTERPFLLFVGSRGHYKNFPLVLQALKLLPDFALVVVGGGAFNRIEQAQSDALGLLARIDHVGAVNNQELNVLYNQAHCLLYPSELEGFGIPVAEAGRAGCPVIAANTSSIPEVHGDKRLLIDQLSAEAIAEKVRMLLDVQFCTEVTRRCQAFSKKFDWNTYHNTLLSIYSEL